MTRRRILRTSILLAVPFLVPAQSAMGEVATFDSLAEGFYGETTFNDGGILFFNPDSRGGPDPLGTYAIDNVSLAFAAFDLFGLNYSPPNVMTLSGYGPGADNWSLHRFGEVSFSTGQLQTFASVDVFHGDDMFSIGNSIILEALLGGQRVASDSVLLTTCCHQFDSLSIQGTLFDTLRLYGEGSVQRGVFFGAIDNVVITPELSSGVFAAFLCLLLLLRRNLRWAHHKKVLLLLFFCAGSFDGLNREAIDYSLARRNQS